MCDTYVHPIGRLVGSISRSDCYKLARPAPRYRSQADSRMRSQATVATITGFQAAEGITDVSLLNFVVSDGKTLIATRYVSVDGCPAATMYYAQGATFLALGPYSRAPTLDHTLVALSYWTSC